MAALPSPQPPAGPGCEPITGGLFAEPVAAASSLAFVAAAAVILAAARRDGGTHGGPAPGSDLRGYAALVAGIGIGSVVQHGPDPAWADPAHDLPLLATLAFVAADSAAALTGRSRVWWWWAAPTAALTPLILLAPRAGDLAQVGVAAVTVGLAVARARAVPPARRRICAALGLLATGATIGTLSRAGGPLCVPESLWQGHAAWHVLAAAGMVVLAPVLSGRAQEASSPSPSRRQSPGVP